MEEYVINEIIDIDCDDEGYIIVKFIIEDEEGNCSYKIESEDYFNWVEEVYGGDDLNYGDDDWDEEFCLTTFFDFTKWMEYEHGPETVKDFIYYSFPGINDLPPPIKQT